ncbi:MAG: glycogen/starch/alpha-glucan phosphorylase [Myxococcota bacterium]|jgi:starch phosphorylase|nr:glycogen/starch/alpha-glucan phosphorylase [Myxococcota bacterium]
MNVHPKSWRKLTQRDLGLDEAAIEQSFSGHVEYTLGKDEFSVTLQDFFSALAFTMRDRLLDRWNKTQQKYYKHEDKRVYYLSMEFLVGRLLDSAMISLGIREEVKKVLAQYDLDLGTLIEQEWDAALGNGGLGRLAACFLDSMATLGLPAMGCGLRYEYGIFRQIIQNGEQMERPDNWLRYGCPWELPRPEFIFPVRFYGRVLCRRDFSGREIFDWVDAQEVVAMAYDVPVPGFGNQTVNTLRLWSGKASREFDFANFNRGDYIKAVEDKNASENISRVLYPNDKTRAGQELRLKQEYFLVSATLQDALRRHLKTHERLSNLHEKAVFQLNDTHPALAVVELLRLLMDEHGMGWDEAWTVTSHCMAYTNHTVLPEALEQWPVEILSHLLPRHMQILFELNHRFLEEVRSRFPGDEAKVQRMSLIQEGDGRKVRMANLAVLGSFSVNGVSRLHSDIVRDRLLRDFSEMWPDKFNNKTNGITPRRWLLECNNGLASLLSEVAPGWPRDLRQLEKVAPLSSDSSFQEKFRAVKRRNKELLATYVVRNLGIRIDPETLFDVQAKRIHEYKRQHMNALHVLRLYLDIKAGVAADRAPRTVFFAGKAAPGYDVAKRIIRLVHVLADTINNDPAVKGRLKVVFLPNYSVSLAEVLIPAADLSEQISTAGMEASGTGNMKFALNGALTIGTLDGANVEIREAVGEENFFLFGLTEPQVVELRRQGYDALRYYNENPQLKEAVDAVAMGHLLPSDPSAFWPLVDTLLLHNDPFLVLADFDAYRECQRRVDQVFRDQRSWMRMAIQNVAHMGRFSSDETIKAYARGIWQVEPLPQDAPFPKGELRRGKH